MLFMLLFGTFVLFTKTAAHEPFKWIVMFFVLAQVVDEARQVIKFLPHWFVKIVLV